jgi:outer membrane protein TolC
MRIFTIITTLVVCIATFRTYGQISLDSCQRLARENYPLIRRYDLIEKSREYTLSNANKAYLPQLKLNVIAGVIDGMPSFSAPGTSESSGVDFNVITIAQLNQTIWDGGVTKVRKEMTNASAEIEKADLEVSLFALEERVNNLFFGILLIDEQIHQLELLKTILERNLKSVQNAIENGTAYKTDLDEIHVEIINADQKIAELTSNRQAYQSILHAMTGSALDLSGGLITPELEETFFTTNINRPELTLFQNQEFLFQAQGKMEKTSLYPKIGLMGLGVFIQPGAEFGTSSINNLMVGGLSLNWNIGGFYTNSNKKKLTELNVQKVNTQRETFLFNTNLELTQTRQELKKYKTLIDQDKKLLTLKGRIRAAYETKYENGITTMTELLNMTNEEHLAKQNLAVHEIQYLMTAYRYKNKSGN